ncbi:MAG: DUF309 domain-containing protein [Planctomyces sp.]|nr:DUF309 domain-containing protein [Planctomyces sp.]
MGPPNFSDPRIDEGITLFNSEEYFACHDVWEDFWSEQTGPEKPFFQGLIQASVAMFHFQEGNLGGARRMYATARARLCGFGPITAGIHVDKLIQDMDLCFEELCEPHSSYPHHVTLKRERIPKIFREGLL